MNRRRFLTLFATAAAVAAVDPERLLWTPGARTHILPPAGGWVPIQTRFGVDFTWDPAAKDLDGVEYVFMLERMRADEYRHLYRGDFDPPSPGRSPHRLMVTTTPSGHEHAWLRERFLDPPKFTVHPRSEADVEHAKVMQQIVDRIAQRVEVRAAIEREIRGVVERGGEYWRRP